MKAFTDINQSKKLAEILPIESADMRYAPFGDTHPWVWDGHLLEKGAIPCWSLAALLDQMICPKLENYVQNIWDLDAAEDDTLHQWLSVQDCQTAVDACVEMIIKLHEQKVLSATHE